MPVATPIRIDSSDSFRIINESNTTATFIWNKRTWHVEPGQAAFVPFDVVRLYFGDPRSVTGTTKRYRDSKGEGDIPKREEEVRRLCVLYGVYGEDTQRLTDKIPKFSIETASGDKLITPAEDRNGKAVQPKEIAQDIKTVDDLAAIIQQQQLQLNELIRHKEKMVMNGPNTDDDVMVDGAEDFEGF